MKPESRARIEQIVHAALELEEQQRAGFLTQQCTGDEDLRPEVEALLRLDTDAKNFLETPALEVAAEAFADKHNSQPSFPSEMSLEGKTVSHYRVLSQLGSGGMGVVYEAEDIRLHRRVALKFLPGNLVNDITAAQRFEREARAASSLNHPGICTIYEVEEYEHQPVIVMELLKGRSLRERMREGPVSTEELLNLGFQLSDALAAAHARGIIHRDLKPGNIFVGDENRVKILDFGIAKVLPIDVEGSQEESLTLDGVIPGTTPYMSPEQVRGDEIDTRSDLFSLGVVLFELATGQRLFARKNRILTVDAILNARPPSPSSVNPALPPALNVIIGKAVEKDRESRYQQASEMRSDLQQLKLATDSGKSVSSKPTDGSIYARSKWFVAVAVLGAALVVVIGGYLRAAPKLTEKDTIVLADFTNTTGDPIFDNTLKQGLMVQLEQSPFLNLVSDRRIQRTLQLMNQSADARVTGQTAQEICERAGGAVVLEGSISSLGAQYVLGLRATNCHTGEGIDEQQTQVHKKEDVLNAVNRMAQNFRSHAGESLSTVEKYSTPLQEATTSSLEALKAYSTGLKLGFSSGFASGIPLLKRATEIDPKFAMAHAHLGLWYSSIGESALARESNSRAYQLRDRVSDRENFFITAMYQRDVTGNMEAAHRTLELWVQTYPRDLYVHGLLSGSVSQQTGRYEQSIEEAKKALALDPEFAPGYINLGFSNFYLSRFDQAESTIREAATHKIQMAELVMLEFYVDFFKGDGAGVSRQAEMAANIPGTQDWVSHSQSLIAAGSGQLRTARSMTQQAVDQALKAGQKERAATYKAGEAVWEGLLENPSAARQTANAALKLSQARDVRYVAAFALALAGESSRAKAIADDLAKLFPEDTSVQFNYLPALRALLALRAGEPEGALETLKAASQYELAVPSIEVNTFFGGLYPVWVRGEAYLAQHEGLAAAAEFEKIVTQHGLVAGDPIGALAYLQLGKAYAIAGDKAKAKASYQEFLTRWKDADPKNAALQQAKAGLIDLG